MDSYLSKFNATLRILKFDFVYTREELDKDMEKYKLSYVHYVSTLLQNLFINYKDVLDMEHKGDASKMYQSFLPRWLAYFEAENII